MSDAILRLINVSKSYQQAGENLSILSEVSMNLFAGTSTALVGASGSGKSTLLHLAGLLDHVTSGDIILNGINTTAVHFNRKAALRGDHIGFIYQFHHLLPEFDALENVMMPLLIRGINVKQAQQRAMALIKLLKLEGRASHRPAQLSGGEQQRFAILRALANQPRVLLADEPTGNLDEKTADHIFKELIDLIKSEKIAALIATHDSTLSLKLDRVIRLKDGRLTIMK